MMGLCILLLFVAVVGAVLGLIKPNLVIWGNTRKTRVKVILIYGIIFVISIVCGVIGVPSNFELAQTALSGKDYEAAVKAFERLDSSDVNYAEAQPLLIKARKMFWSTRLEQAKIKNSNKEYEEVISLLTAYPSKEEGYVEAKTLLTQAKQTLVDLELVQATKVKIKQQEKADQAAQAEEEKESRRLAREQDKEFKRIAKEEERALADYPECASHEAQLQVNDAMENAPLGRVFGLSIIKISNPQQVSASPSSRNCRGNAKLNNAQTYPITYSFYHDGEDVMVQAEVHGLEE